MDENNNKVLKRIALKAKSIIPDSFLKLLNRSNITNNST
jgi:hypothetical protein